MGVWLLYRPVITVAFAGLMVMVGILQA